MASAVPISLYFLRLKFKLGSRGTSVGYKIPPAEVLNRINNSTSKADLKGKLRPDSYGSRTSPSTPTAAKQTVSGLLRKPDSADNSDRKQTPPGLLREPGSIANFDRW